MSAIEQPSNEFVAITIGEARVDSTAPDGVTLSFHLSPTPVPAQWRYTFTNLTDGNRGSVMSTTSPLLHGDDVVWKVSEGDIPNAKHLVEERISQANDLFTQRLADTVQPRELEHLTTSEAEIDRLQQILDGA